MNCYEKNKTKEISFPIGGIGTGCIGLAGNGQLIDIEIFNRPNKGTHGRMSHFAIKAEDRDQVLDARVLNGDCFPPYSGNYNRSGYCGYGFGVDRETLAGLPHFRECTFYGEFPIATLKFKDKKFPGNVMMKAFNPFIPTNEDDSSIPGAFFEFVIKNTSDKELKYTIGMSMNNFYTSGTGIHEKYSFEDISMIHLKNQNCNEEDSEYGDLCMATMGQEVSCQQYWYRGNWFDSLATYWNEFTKKGYVENRVYNSERVVDSAFDSGDMALLTSSKIIMPGETKRFRFVFTWNRPNFYNYWNPQKSEKRTLWKNYYWTLFKNSKESALYACRNWQRLFEITELFKNTLFQSKLPEEVIEAVSANISIIKSPTCIRLEDGSLYGFEGNSATSGCCEGTCTHVWNYEYAVAFLFPKLERSMRSLEYKYSVDDDGKMGFRLMLPPGRGVWDYRPCVDGQYGTVMRVLREYKISGDKKWLESIWPNVKKTIEYAWSETNKDKWDINMDGVIEGRQHHTLDMELFGENAWLTGMYLGGLKAGIYLAKVMGDQKTEELYRKIFESGKKYLNKELFNGEYYYHKINLKDKNILCSFTDGKNTLANQDIFDVYWNEEQEELMHQIGNGCVIDQMLAQWHANLIGIGDIFDKDKVKIALQAIYKNNFVSARDRVNPCRLYSLNDEKGLIICSWPIDKEKPFITLSYAEETMNGFEYAAATHMIQEGFEEEGINCVKAIRDRYDGEKRNPWNEFECGSNYARSMSSYGLLLSYSGFKYDMGMKMIGFAPIHETDFCSFWSVDSAWGKVCYGENQVNIEVLYGTLELLYLDVNLKNKIPHKVIIDGKPIEFCMKNGLISFAEVNVTCRIEIIYGRG